MAHQAQAVHTLYTKSPTHVVATGAFCPLGPGTRLEKRRGDARPLVLPAAIPRLPPQRGAQRTPGQWCNKKPLREAQPRAQRGKVSSAVPGTAGWSGAAVTARCSEGTTRAVPKGEARHSVLRKDPFSSSAPQLLVQVHEDILVTHVRGLWKEADLQQPARLVQLRHGRKRLLRRDDVI